MKIWLGLQLDTSASLPVPDAEGLSERCYTPRAFVQWLEKFYGLQHPPGDIDYLRCEQYRQLCKNYLESRPDAFFAAAFTADQRATAAELLSRRDELIGAGFKLSAAHEKELPPRITVLHHLEQTMLSPDNTFDLRPGFADRLRELIARIPDRRHPEMDILLHEPDHLISPGLHLLLAALQKAGSKVNPVPAPRIQARSNDLQNWQQKIWTENNEQLTARGDGSLIILKATRETHIAAYLARILRDNPQWQPSLLMPERKQTFNTALVLEGLPDLGVAVSSLARPSLQVLKLITAFLWEPVDLRKVIEFLNLIVKPFDQHFALRLARSLANTPGLNGPEWNRTVAVYLNETLIDRASYDKKVDEATVKEQYNFLFGRKRYSQDERIPKSEVRALFSFLLNWARSENSDLTGANLSARQVLASQCKRLVELIDTLPETELNFLETERLVRTVYEPTPTTFHDGELNHLPTAHAPAAVYGQVKELIWWDFTEKEANYFFSRWTNSELNYLANNGIKPLSPKQKNDRLVWQALRPILHTSDRLLLCLSDRVDGEEVLPHLLMGDLEAAFGNSIDQLTVQIDAAGDADRLLVDFKQPEFVDQAIMALPVSGLQVPLIRPDSLLQRGFETPTSIEKLVYYPYQYVFQYGLGLRSNDILSVATDNRLLGNLAHRMIESLLEQKGDEAWDRQAVLGFVNGYLPLLLKQEGAVLLEYGREPESVQFARSMRQACWALVSLIQDNHWYIEGLEKEVIGNFQDTEIHGRADLILRRGKELAIVDLKWRGKSVFREIIKNKEDLQLNLYARTLAVSADTVHTAYFIISDGLMISRNQKAFAGIDPIAPEEDHEAIHQEVMAKLKRTYDWRREQLASGKLETRTEKNAAALDDEYGSVLNDLLEMKSNDARFDDYRSLIGLLE